MKTIFPIGTVAQLNGAEKSLMIIGSLQATEDGTEYDYIGVPFPEGFIDDETFFLFNNEDIEKVHFVGCVNAESQAYNMMIGSDEFRQMVEAAQAEDEDEYEDEELEDVEIPEDSEIE
ncbi:MAG: DUF4176 domain-containing protein [Clostridia bacterium]|nr:DUF4176 domain-containing protein [Clostridia bacterium]